MAEENKIQIIIELLRRGSADDAIKQLEQLDDKSEKASTSMTDLTRSAKAAFAAFGGVSFLRTALNEFIESERAVSRLNAALRSTKQFSQGFSDEMLKLANSLAEVTTFSDDDILNVISKLIALGAPRTEIAKLTESVLDLSTLLDRDLNRAVLAIGNALRGEFGTFEQLGVKFQAGSTSVEKYVAALDHLKQVAGGQAREAAKSLGGEVEQTSKTLKEFVENIGASIAAIIRLGNSIFKGLGEATVDVGKPTEELLKQHDKLRASLEKEIELLQQQGVMAEAVARMLKGDLAAGFTPTTSYQRGPRPGVAGQSIQTRNVGPEGDALARVQRFLALPGSDLALPPATPGTNVPDALAKADALAFWDHVTQLQAEDDAAAKAAHEERMKEFQEQGTKAMQAHFQRVRVIETERELENQIAEAQLEGIDLEMFKITAAHEQRIMDIQELKFEDVDRYNRLIDLENQYFEIQKQRIQEARSSARQFELDMRRVAVAGQQAFASGLAGAITSAFEEGDKAFQRFASNFLRLIAEMILQALILRAIQGAMGGLGFGGLANGGVRFAANGLAGVGTVDQPTYLPKFNVLTGEAGREMLTVLARPRLMQIGGVQAAVGDAGANRLAITSAGDLARRGAVDIRVRLSEGLRAEIVNESVEGARVQVTQDLQEDTRTSRAVKRLVT